MIWEERKKQLEEEKQACENHLETLFHKFYQAKPGEGVKLQQEMTRVDRVLFTIDYLFLINENTTLGLSPDTRAFLGVLANFAKDNPRGTIRVRDFVNKDAVGIKALINEAREKHVLEMRMQANTEFSGYILRNDYANKHITVLGNMEELKEIMRSPV